MASLDRKEEMDRERCFCGHFRSEHRSAEDGRCCGAYGTLTPEAEDESVEVLCHCIHFERVEANYHEVRT
jgi:hypothetical protein